MSHDHGHGHGHGHHHAAKGRLGVVFLLNSGFAVIELVGAYLTNSTAIAADAVHDLGDSLALGFAWLMQRASGSEPDETYSYGLRRLSLVGAMANAMVLVTGGALVLTQSVPRLLEPQEANALGMLGLAVLGVVVNGFAVLRMKGGDSLNERVVRLHLLEDVMGWVAVLVAAAVMLVWPVAILDPLLSIAITLWVTWSALRNLKKTLDVFLQAVPDDVEVQALVAQVTQLEGVCSLRHVHVWSHDGQHHVLTGTVVVQVDELDGALRLRDDAQTVLERAGISHVTLSLAREGDDEEGCA